MKRISKASIIALLIALITPFAAQAKTTITGGPFTNLPATGQVITLKLSGYPTNAGFYLLQCLSAFVIRAISFGSQIRLVRILRQMQISNFAQPQHFHMGTSMWIA